MVSSEHEDAKGPADETALVSGTQEEEEYGTMDGLKPPVVTSSKSGWRPSRELLRIAALFFMYFAGMAFYAGLIPQILIKIRGGDVSKASLSIGLIASTNHLMTFFCSPLFGPLSDRFGRKPLLLLTFVGNVVDALAFAIFRQFAVLVTIHTLTGTANGFYALSYLYMSDVGKKEERSQNFALIGAAMGVAFCIAPAAGGILAKHFGYGLPCAIAAGIHALAFCFVFWGLPESKRDKSTEPIQWHKVCDPLFYLSLLRSSKALTASLLFVDLSESMMMETMIPYVKYKWDWDSQETGVVLSILGVNMFLVQGIVLRLVIPRLGDTATIFWSLVIQVGSSLPMGFLPQGWMLLPLFFFRSLAIGSVPTLQGALSKRYSDEEQGKLMGILSSLKTLCETGGPLLAMGSFRFFTSHSAPTKIPAAPIFLASFFFFCSWLIYLLWLLKLRKQKLRLKEVVVTEEADGEEKDRLVRAEVVVETDTATHHRVN